jgi:hypothetical protein
MGELSSAASRLEDTGHNLGMFADLGEELRRETVEVSRRGY